MPGQFATRYFEGSCDCCLRPPDSALAPAIARHHSGKYISPSSEGDRTATESARPGDYRRQRYRRQSCGASLPRTAREGVAVGTPVSRRPRTDADVVVKLFVAKADSVPDKIASELEQHRAGSRLLRVKPTGEFGLWGMEASETAAVSEFLAARHRSRSTAPRSNSHPAPIDGSKNPSNPVSVRADPVRRPVCKHCGASELSARWGYGYYWHCGMCGENTKMPVECAACGARRTRADPIVKIRKEGARYFRECSACGTSHIVWTET